MLKILKQIKSMTFKEYIDLLKIILSVFPGVLLKIFKKNIWLISERPEEARDNGYWLFKYISENNLQKNCYYTIDFNSYDFHKLKPFKHLIKHGTFKHFVYLWACCKYISAHIDDGLPSRRICYKFKIFGVYKYKFIFLQHGIIHTKPKYLLYENTKADLFVCSSKEETNFVNNFMGYSKNQAVCLGLCRYDNLFDTSKNKNQILIMPTWRSWLANLNENEFQSTDYFKHFFELLNNKNFTALLNNYNKNAIFFLHKGMQKYSNSFVAENITIAKCGDYDVQSLLKTSSFLITDYSSVAFDFAYMKKSLIYFQFDYDEFSVRQKYAKAYFDYGQNGFGEVCKNVSEVVDLIENFLKNDFKNPEKFLCRSNNFFEFFDKNNLARNYEAIQALN